MNLKEIDSQEIFNYSLKSCLLISPIGASIFYIRKLYKACINLDFFAPETNDDKIRQIGITLYFLFRPIFSVIFSLVIVMTTKSGISILTNNTEINNNFFFVANVVCFFVGYSSGDIIDKFEDVGKKIVDKISDISL